MKRLLSFILVFALILFIFSSCNNKEEIVYKSNMLKFSTDAEDFKGVKARYFDILNVISTEINTLEKAHNDDLKYEYPDDYFLNDEYILSTFDPFNVSDLSITDYFNDNLNLDSAKVYYEVESNGRDILFDSGKDFYTLKFSSESSTDIYNVNYNGSNNKYKFIHYYDSPSDYHIIDFIEFTQISSNAYAIQSKLDKCYISFDSLGHIIEFYYSSLKNNAEGNEISLYDSGTNEFSAKNWVFNQPKQNYNTIIEFNDGELNHIDNSSGETKTISIKEKEYEIAFIER